MSSLPPEIITSLLTCLPVKSLLRFRCVCKRWCSQIDSPDFIKLHLNHSITTGSNHSPIAESFDGSTFYSLDSDSLKKVEKLNTPFTNASHKTIFFNTCNGLLLLQADDGIHLNSQRLILFNPSTRKHLVLPTPPSEKNCDGLDGACCLGYDAVNDDYKVFNMVVLIDDAHRVNVFETRVYSLKSKSWRIIKDFAKGVALDGFLGNLLLEASVNGALHTVTLDSPKSIIALDVSKESFNLLPMPNVIEKDVALFTAHVFDGCLTVLCQYRDNRNDVWVMKEYGVKESWSLLMSLKPRDSRISVMPVVYSKTRSEVLLSYDCQELVWYDLRKKTFRNNPIHGSPLGFGPVVCVESLVSVGSHGKIDQKKKQQGEEKMKAKVIQKKRDDFLSKGFKLKL